MSHAIRIALIGKPNSGKSSLFNLLTGLKQKVGNYPGITVEKRSGTSFLQNELKAQIIDLPGVYSLYPRTPDEHIVSEILTNPAHPDYPDKIILVADVTNLKNCLLLLTQLIDLNFKVVLALNMIDLADKSGVKINSEGLSKSLGVPVVRTNARTGRGLEKLKSTLAENFSYIPCQAFEIPEELKDCLQKISMRFPWANDYGSFLLFQQFNHLKFLTSADRLFFEHLIKTIDFNPWKHQQNEIVSRYENIQRIINQSIEQVPQIAWKKWTPQIDKIVTHKVWGYVILFVLLFSIFQFLFAWAQVPMEMIDNGFVVFSRWLSEVLPKGALSDLLSKGIVSGIGGIVIFIPQILILFAFVSLLEETGYMARVVFLMDKIMRPLGMHGKSITPLISGWACAIPAIMASRTIDNPKERLITIFVLPFMSCSARLPVYSIIIALVIPHENIFGVINLQGVVIMALYFLGVTAVIITAFVMKLILTTKMPSFLLMELPIYRMPRWRNVGITLVEKVKTFVVDAGKIILAISVLLWALSVYGPADFTNAEEIVRTQTQGQVISEQEFENRLTAFRLEHSYAGTLGKYIEPIIEPLGFDWKIGIALITSFAAREAFVGTVATIYSLQNADSKSLIDNLRNEKDPSGNARFTLATGLSLLIFYTFAMQCMSTLAIVKKETRTWKWPILQMIYMSVLAYVSSLLVFQFFV